MLFRSGIGNLPSACLASGGQDLDLGLKHVALSAESKVLQALEIVCRIGGVGRHLTTEGKEEQVIGEIPHCTETSIVPIHQLEGQHRAERVTHGWSSSWLELRVPDSGFFSSDPRVSVD